MEYLSTKQLEKAWGISESRIVRLAKAGRFPGAKLVGKSWVFPPDTAKPADMRRRENRPAAPGQTFRFPLYFYCAHSSEEIETAFTADERSLYRAQRLFLSGSYRDCAGILRQLLADTENRYVRFGALYYLTISEIFLRNYDTACRRYYEMKLLFSEETEHPREIAFLIHDMESYFTGNRYFLDGFHVGPLQVYPPEMTGYLLVISAYSDMLRAVVRGIPAGTAPYELILRSGHPRFSPLSGMMLHIYLAILCSLQNRPEDGASYIAEACRIAEEHDLERVFAYLFHYYPDLFSRALEERNPAQLARLQAFSAEFHRVFHELLDHLGKYRFLQLLRPMDYRLIGFARSDLSHKEIAAILGISVSAVSKRYTALYAKTGTHSKNELAQLAGRVFETF